MNPKEERQHPPPAGQGNTVTAQGETQSPKAREPFERDESADSQSAEDPTMRRIGAMAHDDVADGLRDTSKGEATDATYERLRQDSAPAPQDKVNRNQKGR